MDYNHLGLSLRLFLPIPLINPYLAFETLDYLQQENRLPKEMESSQIADNYIAAIKKGILKTMSKMGISTLRSYTGAQLFEAIGLNRSVVDEYFTDTSSRIGGIGLAEIAREAVFRQKEAFEQHPSGVLELDFGGEYHFRHNGEQHLWNPTTIARLQHAVKHADNQACDGGPFQDLARPGGVSDKTAQVSG